MAAVAALALSWRIERSAATSGMIHALGLEKEFRPPGGMGDLLRGKFFGAPVRALAGVSLQVAAGEIVCLMGPNGSGKTTLLRILAGQLLPSGGRAEVAGLDVARAGARVRRDVALVVGDERSFLANLSGRDNLHFFAALHGLSARDARHRSDVLLGRVGLADAADRLVFGYSRGMKQRLALARGLLGSARVLLLDEPTIGLDPLAALDLRRFLREGVIKREGRTAVIGSNDPGEARLLADRVLYLDTGVLRGESGPDEIDRWLGLQRG
jgi:ABC-2 type transport system ATP-binding protein